MATKPFFQIQISISSGFLKAVVERKGRDPAVHHDVRKVRTATERVCLSNSRWENEVVLDKY